jgi:hypothetical protein
MTRLDPVTRAAAHAAAEQLTAEGGRALGSWVRLATQLFDAVPAATHRHAILLTDGPDDGPPGDLRDAVRAVSGRFRCDCRGLGADWVVPELQGIAEALHGTVDIVAVPEELPTELADLARRAVRRGVADVRLELRLPAGATALFVRQISPDVRQISPYVGPPQSGDPTGGVSICATGSWAEETREYHLAIRLPHAWPTGVQQTAGQVRVWVGDGVVAQAVVTAAWSSDPARTTPVPTVLADDAGKSE